MGKLVAALFVLAACGGGKRVVVTSTHIEIYDPIRFAPGSDRVVAGGEKSIAAIATTLNDDPSILKVAVEATVTPADGATDAERAAIGERRARAVRDQLIARGVAAERLETDSEPARDATIRFIVMQRKP